MADLTGKTIPELPTASSLSNNDQFVVSSGGSMKKTLWSTIKSAIGSYIASTFFPLSVARGGTGATTAAAAWTNLGGASANGYSKLPDGTLIQWGYATGKSSGDTVSFVGTPAFVSYVPVVILIPAYNSNNTIHCIFASHDITYSNFKIWAFDTTAGALSVQTNLAVRWVAIGRWKA